MQAIVVQEFGKILLKSLSYVVIHTISIPRWSQCVQISKTLAHSRYSTSRGKFQLECTHYLKITTFISRYWFECMQLVSIRWIHIFDRAATIGYQIYPILLDLMLLVWLNELGMMWLILKYSNESKTYCRLSKNLLARWSCIHDIDFIRWLCWIFFCSS